MDACRHRKVLPILGHNMTAPYWLPGYPVPGAGEKAERV